MPLPKVVKLLDLFTPDKIEVDENGHIKGLWIQPRIVGKIQNGRPVPVEAKGNKKFLECDLLITAVGQGIESKAFEKDGIPVTKGVIDALSCAGVKDVPGIYAGGEIVFQDLLQ